jgi:hypothetical protein
MFFTILSSLLMIIFSGTSPDEQQPVWVLKMMQVVLMAEFSEAVPGGWKMLHFKYLKVYGISYSPPVADYFFSLMLFVILIPFYNGLSPSTNR